MRGASDVATDADADTSTRELDHATFELAATEHLQLTVGTPHDAHAMSGEVRDVASMDDIHMNKSHVRGQVTAIRKMLDHAATERSLLLAIGFRRIAEMLLHAHAIAAREVGRRAKQLVRIRAFAVQTDERAYQPIGLAIAKELRAETPQRFVTVLRPPCQETIVGQLGQLLLQDDTEVCDVRVRQPDANAELIRDRGHCIGLEDRARIDEARVAALQVIDRCQRGAGVLVLRRERTFPVAHRCAGAFHADSTLRLVYCEI